MNVTFDLESKKIFTIEVEPQKTKDYFWAYFTTKDERVSICLNEKQLLALAAAANDAAKMKANSIFFGA